MCVSAFGSMCVLLFLVPCVCHCIRYHVSLHSSPHVCQYIQLPVCVTAFGSMCVLLYLVSCVRHGIRFHVFVTASSSFCSNYLISENLFWRLKFIKTSQLLCQTLYIHCLKSTRHTHSILCLYTLKRKYHNRQQFKIVWDLHVTCDSNFLTLNFP